MANEVMTRETAAGEVVSMLMEAQGMVIKSEMDNQAVANRIVATREVKKHIEEKILKGPRETKRQATKVLSELEATLIKPLDEVLDIYRRKSAAFVMAENERRAKLQEKADAKFEKAAEKSAATGKPMTVAPQFIPQVQTSGVRYATYYKAEVTDLKALCAAVVAGTVDISAIEANMPFLNGLAKAHKTAGKVIAPGVVCVEDKRVL
jgi:hypothetical protein